MFVRKTLLSSAGRATAIATIAALAITAIAPSAANARHRHRLGGGAAAAAAFAGIVGTGLAIAAAQNRRAYYDEYYGGGPVYVAPAPGYYYGVPAYGPYGSDSTSPYVDSRAYGW